MAETQNILEVRGLKKYYRVRNSNIIELPRYLRAVDDISFTVRRGETFGVVGESGCGKSTLLKTLMRLTKPTDGSITFNGQDLLALRGEKLRKTRADFQMIFQNPYYSLNPRMTIRELIAEPLRIHQRSTDEKTLNARVEEMLDIVGLQKAAADRYPHEFSGGQRQRVGIARALIMNPSLITCDEPVSALDVSIQSQILNLLSRLQREMHLTYFFISHNLAVVKYISDRIAVMYLGQLVEMADAEELYRNPKHPYTKALLSTIPTMDGRRSERLLLRGEIPSPIDVPDGCRFCTRCPYATEYCMCVPPKPLTVKEGHWAACHYIK